MDIWLIVTVLLLGVSISTAQVAGDFRSHTTGNWSDVNAWERYDGATWVNPAPSTPVGTETITIQSTHTMTVDATVSSISGYIKNQGVLTIGTGSLSFSTGTYEHAINGGTIPTATWNTGSTCLVTGATTTSPSNGGQSFSNFTWKCASQSASLNLLTAVGTYTFSKDFTVSNTGTGRFQFGIAAAGTIGSHNVLTVNIGGNLIVDGSVSDATDMVSVTSNGSSNNYTDNIINVTGNVTVTGNNSNVAWTNFSPSRGSQGGTGTTVWNLSGDFSMSNATTQNSNNAGAKFVFAKSGTQILTFSNVTAAGASNYTVNSGSTLDVGSSVLSGTGSFILSSGAGLATAHSSGINGNITCTGANGGGNSFRYKR